MVAKKAAIGKSRPSGPRTLSMTDAQLSRLIDTLQKGRSADTTANPKEIEAIQAYQSLGGLMGRRDTGDFIPAIGATRLLDEGEQLIELSNLPAKAHRAQLFSGDGTIEERSTIRNRVEDKGEVLVLKIPSATPIGRFEILSSADQLVGRAPQLPGI